jgi:hypothetical protein
MEEIYNVAKSRAAMFADSSPLRFAAYVYGGCPRQLGLAHRHLNYGRLK